MKNKGFISLTIVLIISGILFVLVSYSSLESANYFDQAIHKEYRIMNHYYAKTCIDQAIIMLAHDYFFEINNANEIIDFPYYHCQILQVKNDNNSDINTRKILTLGNYMKANVYMNAEVKIYDNRIDIIKVE